MAYQSLSNYFSNTSSNLGLLKCVSQLLYMEAKEKGIIGIRADMLIISEFSFSFSLSTNFMR